MTVMLLLESIVTILHTHIQIALLSLFFLDNIYIVSDHLMISVYFKTEFMVIIPSNNLDLNFTVNIGFLVCLTLRTP